MKNILSILISLSVITALLVGCSDEIPVMPQTDSTAVSIDPVIEPPPESEGLGEFSGSYLTLYLGHAPTFTLGLPKMHVFKDFQDVNDYYDSSCNDYFYGVRFTLEMASFTDDFLAENDVLVLAINEPSSYINHTAEPIRVENGRVKFNITRHIHENAPLKDAQYHLVFIGPKGSFDGLQDMEFDIEISEVVDVENNSAFDAERFRQYYPEYWNFVYRTDALTESPEVTIDSINSYDELVYFYEMNKNAFDLESEFRNDVGMLYDRQICERYILLITIIPVTDASNQPSISEFFVNNLEIYLAIDAEQPENGEKPEACYLLVTAVERSDLEGVNLATFNLSIE